MTELALATEPARADRSDVIGLFIVCGWVVVGLIVAVVEWISGARDTDQTMATVLCVAGAVAGGFAGQTTGSYVFGQPLGFLFSAGGAELLLRFCRSREGAARPAAEVPRPVIVVETTRPLGVRFLEAFGWGVLCGLALAISALVALMLVSHLYPQRYSQIPVQLLFIPFGLIVGFVLAATARLARPQWSSTQMFVVVAALTIGYGALIFGWGKANAQPAVIKVNLLPNPITAVACSPASCPPATPPWTWTFQGTVSVQETAGVGGHVNFIDLTGWVQRETRGRFTKAATIHLGADQISRTSGTNYVDRHGMLTYPVTYNYRTEDGRSRIRVDVTVDFSDDSGHRLTNVAGWIVR